MWPSFAFKAEYVSNVLRAFKNHSAPAPLRVQHFPAKDFMCTIPSINFMCALWDDPLVPWEAFPSSSALNQTVRLWDAGLLDRFENTKANHWWEKANIPFHDHKSRWVWNVNQLSPDSTRNNESHSQNMEPVSKRYVCVFH